ncbi:1886_t:CDS:2 [Diversispora eburnea]|uniref:1886_t:CDS:1 n=1 Tax=Diversispora eburnea TaxID=1213867 RepID=A0A9N9A9L4_9GLOM|nr:1886_t:CDS:2 [Diversispora eburnea]
MSNITTYTTTTVAKNSKPRLLLKTTMNNTTAQSTVTATASITLSSSPITGSFYLPPPQKTNRKGRFLHKHLRKPPSFDTYVSGTEPVDLNKPHAYYTELMYAKKAINGLSTYQPRARRGSSTTVKFVRFANDFNDDGSSITSSSSSSSSADDWDPQDIDEEDEDEEFIFMTPRIPIHERQDIKHHNRAYST